MYIKKEKGTFNSRVIVDFFSGRYGVVFEKHGVEGYIGMEIYINYPSITIEISLSCIGLNIHKFNKGYLYKSNFFKKIDAAV